MRDPTALAEPHDRLKWARQNAGYDTARAAAKAMGIEEPTYLGHENGSRGMTRAAARYARFFKISLDWLTLGRGMPTMSHRGDRLPSRTVMADRLPSTHRKIVSSYDPERPENEVPVAALRIEESHEVPKGEIPQVAARLGMGHALDADVIEIPVGGGSVAAVRVMDTWRVPERILRRRLADGLEKVHIVECEGDSMSPRIQDGDFVFIDTSRTTPSPPGIFALYDGFGQTLKRLEIIPNTDPPKVKIIPENPAHTTYERNLDEVAIIGRYVARLTMD